VVVGYVLDMERTRHMTACNRIEACQQQQQQQREAVDPYEDPRNAACNWIGARQQAQQQQREAVDLYEGPRNAANYSYPQEQLGSNKPTRMGLVRGQLALTVSQALEGLAEGREAAVIQRPEDQKEEEPSLAEDQEGEARMTGVSRC